MKARDLAIFDAVVVTGSIQAAATKVGLTQSAVTRVIQRLEDDLRVDLFDRTARPIRLTPRGVDAYAHARTVLDALDDLRGAFAEDGVIAGPLRIGVSHALAPLALADGRLLGLDAFPAIAPQIIAGWSKQLLEALQRHELDLAAIVLEGGATPPNWTAAAPLARAAVRIVVAADGAERPISLADANTCGWALNLDGCGYRRALFAALDERGITPNVVLQTNAIDLQLALVQAGRACALLPLTVGALVAGYAVAPAECAEFSFDADIHLIARKARPPNARLRQAVETHFRDALSMQNKNSV